MFVAIKYIILTKPINQDVLSVKLVVTDLFCFEFNK